MVASRPTNMAHKNNVYYPAGLPTEDSPETCQIDEYKDHDLGTFWICYTKKQVEDEVKKWGFFSPYFPLLQTYLSTRQKNSIDKPTSVV